MAQVGGRRPEKQGFLQRYLRALEGLQGLIPLPAEPNQEQSPIEGLVGQLMALAFLMGRHGEGPERGDLRRLWDEYARTRTPRTNFYRDCLHPLLGRWGLLVHREYRHDSYCHAERSEASPRHWRSFAIAQDDSSLTQDDSSVARRDSYQHPSGQALKEGEGDAVRGGPAGTPATTCSNGFSRSYQERLKPPLRYSERLKSPLRRGGPAGTPPPAVGVPATSVPDEAMELLFASLFGSFHFRPREGEADEAAGIVDPEMLGRLFERRMGDRHEKGAYYTPRFVAVFMGRQALKLYLEESLPAESREALDRLVESANADGLRDPTAALAALRRVKLCDPACGAGAFLVTMLQELSRLRLCLSCACGPAAPSAYQEQREILRDNLCGVDLDPAALEIARQRLWLSLVAESDGEEPPRLAALECHLALGDSLLDLDWAGASPGPIGDGRFDIVMMNPPYLGASRVPGHAREGFRGYAVRLRRRHGFASDLYVHFLHLGLELLKEGGVLSAITSSSFLTNSSKEQLRRELLRHRLRLLMPLGPRLFAAKVYSSIVVVQKGRGTGARQVRFVDLRREDVGAGDGAAAFSRPGVTVTAEEYERAFGAVFFEPTPANRYLFDVLMRDPRFVSLGIVAPALDTGIHSGNVRHRLFHRELVPGKELHRLLQGTQVLRYGVWWESQEARYRYVDVQYRPDPARRGTGRGGKPSGRGEYWHFCGAVENHQVEERLLMRQTGDEPFVGYIYQGQERVYTDNTLHTLLLTEEGRRLGLSYRYLLALLNSSSVRWIYRALAQEEGRMLAQVKTAVVNRLPIPIPSEPQRERLEGLVGEIQSIHHTRGLPLSSEAAQQVAALQRAIDEQVAGLFGLHG